MRLLISSAKLTFWVFIASISLSATSLFLYIISRPPVSPEVLGTLDKDSCREIFQGGIITPDGEQVSRGFDEWGFNYEKRLFNGNLCSAVKNAAECSILKDAELVIKWNEAYLSNKDCDSDGMLDRHPGYVNFQGSGAWVSNNIWGSYLGTDSKEHFWTYFVKAVAAPESAELNGGVWYDERGTEFGKEIWGQFAIIEEIYSDPYGEYQGRQFLSPVGPGLGKL